MGTIFVISGPSGVGKGTLVRLLMAEDPSLALSVSCTTRQPRPGERNGQEYFFLSREEFLARCEKGDFLEYDEHFGYFYGTPKSFVTEQLRTKSVILEIDVMGAAKVKRSWQNEDASLVMILIIPPDLDELERRLKGRKSESEEERRNRLERVRFELSQREEYDYVVINDDLQKTKQKLQAIIADEKKRRKGDKND